ncbi:hypothetical protein Tco_0884665 [Tanacetum coccineum]
MVMSWEMNVYREETYPTRLKLFNTLEHITTSVSIDVLVSIEGSLKEWKKKCMDKGEKKEGLHTKLEQKLGSKLLCCQNHNDTYVTHKCEDGIMLVPASKQAALGRYSILLVKTDIHRKMEIGEAFIPAESGSLHLLIAQNTTKYNTISIVIKIMKVLKN